MILTIDDDDEVNYILNRMCKSIGVDSIDARSYKYALDILESRNDIELILCDMYFGCDKLGGLDFINQSKARNIQIPIVIISGSPDPKLSGLSLNAGAWRFVKKPMTKEKLRVLHEGAKNRRIEHIKLMNDEPIQVRGGL